jgi:hypothetical protein
LTHHFTRSKRLQIQPKATVEQEVIEISSDEESEDKVMKENNKFTPSKKRALSNSATGSPSKRRIILDMATDSEDLDSDDDPPPAVPMRAVPAATFPDVKVERGGEKIASSGNDAAKGKDGRYMVTQKVKVDLIENLHEVPARWPIQPEGINAAYVLDLNNDKRWWELDTNSKKKRLDRFLKQEVCFTYFDVTGIGNLTAHYI